MCLVDKNDCRTSVELFSDRLDVRMSNVIIPFSISDKKRDTISLELVKCISNLQGQLRIQDIGQCSKESVFFGVHLPQKLAKPIASSDKVG